MVRYTGNIFTNSLVTFFIVIAIVIHIVIFLQMAILGIIGLHIEGENFNDLVAHAKRLVQSMRKQNDQT